MFILELRCFWHSTELDGVRRGARGWGWGWGGDRLEGGGGGMLLEMWRGVESWDNQHRFKPQLNLRRSMTDVGGRAGKGGGNVRRKYRNKTKQLQTFVIRMKEKQVHKEKLKTRPLPPSVWQRDWTCGLDRGRTLIIRLRLKNISTTNSVIVSTFVMCYFLHFRLLKCLYVVKKLYKSIMCWVTAVSRLLQPCEA